jgi:hypothetical protein
MTLRDCYNCEHYQLEGKVTSGKGKKSTSKNVISFCKKHNKSIAEIWFCNDFKIKDKKSVL